MEAGLIAGIIPCDAMFLLLAISASVAFLFLGAWLYLVFARGFYWRTDFRLDAKAPSPRRDWPSVAALVPAREEADFLPHTLPTLLRQQYPGNYHIFLIDDQSSDSTGPLACSIARHVDSETRFTLVQGLPLPPGWAGKVWALEQGVRAAADHNPDYIWLTDADVAHDSQVLVSLVEKAQSEGLAMVSVTAQLRCKGFWDRLLVSAFIYFFGKVFPFRWVNDPRHRKAAAAGGCILVRWKDLAAAGGMKPIANAIIDDCALARLVKLGASQRNSIWLGLSHDVRSVRAYGGSRRSGGGSPHHLYPAPLFPPVPHGNRDWHDAPVSAPPGRRRWRTGCGAAHRSGASSSPRLSLGAGLLDSDGRQFSAHPPVVRRLGLVLAAASPCRYPLRRDDGGFGPSPLAEPRRSLEGPRIRPQRNVSASDQRMNGSARYCCCPGSVSV